MNQPTLMIPGPVTVEDEVLREMAQPVRAHYGADWTAIYNETRGLLQQVFRTQADVHILVGSGSAGLDAAIGSLAATGEKAIVGANGFFGDRLTEICLAYGLEVVRVEAPLGEPLDPARLADTLAANPDAAMVCLVHLETSTAVVNPLAELAATAGERDVPVVVDAVSSLGGVRLDMDAWGIDICVSSSQKCLGAPPGVAPIAVSERAWEMIEAKPERNHGWYLNLQTWKRYARDWGEWHPFPVTMATNNVQALRAGLKSLLAEGLEARIERYTDLALRLRNGARDLGLEPFTPDEELAPVLTAICGPDAVSTREIVNHLLENHGIQISGGLGPELGDRIFRVGHMGPVVSEVEIDAVLHGLAEFMTVLEA